MTGACAEGTPGSVLVRSLDKYFHFHPRISYAKLPSMANYIFIAKVTREEPVEGIKRVFLELIRDEDAVELVGGEEFVTVAMKVDPFA